MKYLSLFLSMALIMGSACTASKNNSQATNPDVPTEQLDRQKEILDAGYVIATVVDLQGADGCGFVLELKDGKKLLNPVAWEDPMYKKNGALVYLKYRASKAPQNGCLQSTPVVIEEIKFIE